MKWMRKLLLLSTSVKMPTFCWSISFFDSSSAIICSLCTTALSCVSNARMLTHSLNTPTLYASGIAQACSQVSMSPRLGELWELLRRQKQIRAKVAYTSERETREFSVPTTILMAQICAPIHLNVSKSQATHDSNGQQFACCSKALRSSLRAWITASYALQSSVYLECRSIASMSSKLPYSRKRCRSTHAKEKKAAHCIANWRAHVLA